MDFKKWKLNFNKPRVLFGKKSKSIVCPHSNMGMKSVGSTYPGGGEAPKGLAVRQLKSYASWVQTVLIELEEREPCSQTHGGLSPKGDSNKSTHIGEILISLSRDPAPTWVREYFLTWIIRTIPREVFRSNFC